MESIKKLIKSENWKEILEYGASLTDEQRYSVISELTQYTEKDRKLLGNTYVNYLFIVCIRSYKDIEKTKYFNGFSALHWFINDAKIGSEPLEEYFRKFPPNYMDRYLEDESRDRYFWQNFRIIWNLHKNGWIKFNENIFTVLFFTLYGFENSHIRDAEYLIQNRDILEKVFLQFYKYEIPVLESIKCETIEYPNGLSVKAGVYWTEVFKILIEKKAVTDRSIVRHLLESLLNNWKKPHLVWLCGILELFKPSNSELLEYQNLIFSGFNTGNTQLINFSQGLAERISKEENFNYKSYISNVQSVFAVEKIDKSILGILSVIDYGIQKFPELKKGLADGLKILFTQTSEKIQLKTAEIMIQLEDEKGLKKTVSEYDSAIKKKAKALLLDGGSSVNTNTDKKIKKDSKAGGNKK